MLLAQRWAHCPHLFWCLSVTYSKCSEWRWMEQLFLELWSPLWKHHQVDHYLAIDNKHTSLRWATYVIHCLLMTAWDLWQNCLDQLHGTTETWTLQKHTALDALILIDFWLGSASMLHHCRPHWLHHPWGKQTLLSWRQTNLVRFCASWTQRICQCLGYSPSFWIARGCTLMRRWHQSRSCSLVCSPACLQLRAIDAFHF